MKRILAVLTVTALLVVMLVAGSGLPASAQNEPETPGNPTCGWYLNWEDPEKAWWEYWCWWPGWGWEFVFWVWD